MRPSCVALLCAAVGIAGCGDTLVVAARVVRPAVLSVRAFPQVYVTSAADADSSAVADALAAHLEAWPGPAGARLAVRRCTPEHLIALRAGRGIARVSVAIEVEVVMDEAQRPDFNSRPTDDCGPRGCDPSTRPYPVDIQTLTAQARFTVEDGPTGRALQQVVLETRDEGSDALSMRGRAVLELAARVGGLVDGGARSIRVELVDVRGAEAERALARIERGDWAGGAEVLARLTTAPGFARRPQGERAALLFDLGQARRFAGPEDATAGARLDAAAESMRAALHLERRVLYAEGLRDLERQRADLSLSAEQREAAAHNFALSRAAPAPPVPDAPAAYRAPRPDGGATP
jgi:hypothetical protein